uniref:Ig-like domain-containing protein n=1 Tax=Strix occidentalis caurina TaxID=311401 RepID=A0A8D0F016_STROC
TDPSAAWLSSRPCRATGETVDLSCYQNYTTLAFIFWYQQPPRNGLKLVASISTWMKNSYEEGYSEPRYIRSDTAHIQYNFKGFLTEHCNGRLWEILLSISGKNDEIIPPAVAIFSPSKQEIQQKSKATLVCLASGFYPDYLKLFWKVNGAKRTDGVGTDEFSTQNGSTYSLTSRLRISAQEWFNPLNRFECVATFFKNGTLESINKFIYGDAVMLVSKIYVGVGSSSEAPISRVSNHY